jgi:hypothetical protein
MLQPQAKWRSSSGYHPRHYNQKVLARWAYAGRNRDEGIETLMRGVALTVRGCRYLVFLNIRPISCHIAFKRNSYNM